MAVNSINTNIGAYYAQSNIGKASNMASSSIARLSSGDRIVRAADDVAAMSAGTSLRTNVTTLRMALVNTSQGASMLQVADGALSQITDILQRQKAIAVQSGAGSLSSSERSFLNQEFTNLTAEIDRLASQTNFNGVTLLDGSLFDITSLGQNSAAADRAEGSITVSTYANIAAFEGETIDLNGQTIEFDTNGAVGAGNIAVDLSALTGTSTDLSQAMVVLANTLNASTNTSISAATYEADAGSNTLQIQARSGGNMSETYEIDRASFSTNANFTVEGRLTNTANIFTLQGASELGLARGDTVGVGTIGDGIINTHAQTAANISFNFTNATIADGDTITVADGAGGTFNFEFDTNASVANLNLRIDITGITNRADQLDLMVDRVNNYANTTNDDFVVKQIEARREGDNVILEKRETGNVVQTDGATAITAFAAGNANVVLTGSTTLANGTDTGINTAGVSNADFVGTVSGFEATYSGTANVIDLSVTVGASTYSASAVNVGTDATVRFTSVEGDFFDIDFQGATQSLAAGDQAAADNIATRLDTAFSSVNFVQDREIASYSAAGDILTNSTVTGSLTGSSFSLQLSDFTGAQIDDVRISAPVTGSTNGSIEFDVNGVTYRSQNDIGTSLGANSLTQFVSLEDGNDVLTFRNGATAIQFDTAARASSFETALETAFGFGEGGETLAFQVGVTTSDTLEVSIGTVTTDNLFSGQTLDILTQATAANASDVIDAAIDIVTGVRADVGALQSRFDFAAANVESSIQNQDAARAVLLDTDIAAESTAYSTAQVQLQAGISVLAQANLLPQNLLKLIG